MMLMSASSSPAECLGVGDLALRTPRVDRAWCRYPPPLRGSGDAVTIDDRAYNSIDE